MALPAVLRRESTAGIDLHNSPRIGPSGDDDVDDHRWSPTIVMIVITCTTDPYQRGGESSSPKKRGRMWHIQCVQTAASSLQLDWKALSSKAVKITEVKGNEPAAMYWFPKAARIGGMTLQPTLNTTCLGREKKTKTTILFFAALNLEQNVALSKPGPLSLSPLSQCLCRHYVLRRTQL